MSTPVTYVANQYNIPAYQDTGYAQGTGNLSSYLIALATGGLTLSGGIFPLTADADFGASFGLKSIYYKSRDANVSSTGVIRLGNTEIIGWRNAAHLADVTLTVDSSNNFIFGTGMNNMGIGTTTPGSYRVRINSTNFLGLSIYSTAAASAAYLNLENDSTNVWYIANNCSATSIPNVLSLNYATADVARFATTGALTIFATSNQLVLGTTRTVTVTAPTPAASSRTWTIPDITADGTFASLTGVQTFTGAKTFSATLTMSAATIAMGSNKITGLAAGSANGDALRFEQLFGGDLTLTGNLIFNPVTKGVQGTNTNTTIAAGLIGETISSAVTNVAAPSSTQYGDLTSINVTAGHWIIFGQATFSGSLVTATNLGISVTSGNSATGLTSGDSLIGGLGATAAANSPIFVTIEAKLSGTVTHYLKVNYTYSGGSPTASGKIMAIRIG